MPAEQALQTTVSLLAVLTPAAVGVYAWRRRHLPEAVALAALAWVLSLWGFLYSLEPVAGSAWARTVLRPAGWAALGVAAPLWLVLALLHTGRRPARTVVIFVSAIAFATLALIATNPLHGLVWGLDGRGPFFWADLVYRTLLVFVGGALLLPRVVRPGNVLFGQGLCLLVAFLAPWAAATAYHLGLASAAGFDLVPPAFVVSALALVAGISLYRLLDLSPVAREAVVEGMDEGVVVLDRRNRVVDANRQAARVFGRAVEDLVGRSLREISALAGAQLEGEGALMRRYEDRGAAREEVRLGSGDEARYYEVSLTPLHGAHRRKGARLLVLRDVTGRKRAEARLEKMARYDALTGLPNRSFFVERLAQEIARADRRRRSLALMFLDLDGFKSVNDSLGHEVGDLLLKETARRLTEAVREYDVVARLAGDEFTIILPEIDDPGDAGTVAERVVGTLARPFELAGHEVRITASVGICPYPAGGADPETLLKNADAAMYRAKRAGKDRYEVFTGGGAEGFASGPAAEADLRRALREEELVVHYQPAMNTGTGGIASVEALVRWQHPERGLLHPDAFLPLAERTGMIFALERRVLREACRQMRTWQDRYPLGTSVSVGVNLSAGHFAHPNLVGEVSGVLRETGLPPESLALEIKEEALDAGAAATLRSLNDLGVRIVLDDFGAGRSSLSELERLPLAALKIAPPFVRGLQSEKNRELVASIVSLAHALGLEAIAGGVETPQQLVRLKNLGCDAVQGRYFAEPLPAGIVASYLIDDLYR